MAMLVPPSGIAGAPPADFQRGAAEAASLRWGGVCENAAVENFLSGRERGVPQLLGLSDPGGSAGTIYGGAPPARIRWHCGGLRGWGERAARGPGESRAGKDAGGLSKTAVSAGVSKGSATRTQEIKQRNRTDFQGHASPACYGCATSVFGGCRHHRNAEERSGNSECPAPRETGWSAGFHDGNRP